MFRRVNWLSEETKAILTNNDYTLNQMSELLGVSRWLVSRKRRELYTKQHIYGHGRSRALTNKERKERYNAKIKEHGYQPIYKWNNDTKR